MPGNQALRGEEARLIPLVPLSLLHIAQPPSTTRSTPGWSIIGLDSSSRDGYFYYRHCSSVSRAGSVRGVGPLYWRSQLQRGLRQQPTMHEPGMLAMPNQRWLDHRIVCRWLQLRPQLHPRYRLQLCDWRMRSMCGRGLTGHISKRFLETWRRVDTR